MIKRQFIAGRLPRLRPMDRIQRCSDGDKTWMECVAGWSVTWTRHPRRRTPPTPTSSQ